MILNSQATTVDDGYGNQTPSGAAEVLTVCEIQQRTRLEAGGQGELSDTGWLIVLPASVNARTSDIVVADGVRYELVGDPWAARNPRTRSVSHVEASARVAA